MKISVVLGTRPEVIKLAPVILEAKRRGHKVQVIFTGQHREMATRLLQYFGIKPNIDLKAMMKNQGLTDLSARILDRLEKNGKRIFTDCLLVQGDTTSAFIAAYWAFCQKIPVAHVEAGLRTFDLTAPFPEEANRQLISRIASLHFAPTERAVQALLNEGIPQGKIFQVGNSGIDALLHVLSEKNSKKIPKSERLDPSILPWVGSRKLVLVTAHRRESFGSGFEGIAEGLKRIVDTREDTVIVYPVHPNPNVRKIIMKKLGRHPRIRLCEPLPYIGFVQLMERADVLVTDSGGIQEEAPTLGKLAVVLRTTTERPEGVKMGFSKLVGTQPDLISSETLKAIEKQDVPKLPNPYGDGQTSRKIVDLMEKFAIPRYL